MTRYSLLMRVATSPMFWDFGSAAQAPPAARRHGCRKDHCRAGMLRLARPRYRPDHGLIQSAVREIKGPCLVEPWCRRTCPLGVDLVEPPVASSSCKRQGIEVRDCQQGPCSTPPVSLKNIDEITLLKHGGQPWSTAATRRSPRR